MSMEDTGVVKASPGRPWARRALVPGVVLGSLILGAVTRGLLFPPDPEVEVRRVEVTPTACSSLATAYNDQLRWANDQLSWATEANTRLLELSRAFGTGVPEGAGFQAWLDAYQARAEQALESTEALSALLDRQKTLVSAGATARNACLSQ